MSRVSGILGGSDWILCIARNKDESITMVLETDLRLAPAYCCDLKAKLILVLKETLIMFNVPFSYPTRPLAFHLGFVNTRTWPRQKKSYIKIDSGVGQRALSRLFSFTRLRQLPKLKSSLRIDVCNMAVFIRLLQVNEYQGCKK